MSGTRTRPFGDGYRLWVQVPSSDDPAATYPVLWLLDGRSLFPLVSSVVQWLARRPETTGVHPMLVAAVDHDPPETSRRYFDFSFAPPNEIAGLSDIASGGGQAFLRLLAGEARDLVEASFPVDPARRALLGHSMSGYFALQTVARDRAQFGVVGAISPSIWWNVADLVAELHEMANSNQAVFLAVGGLEEPTEVLTEADIRRRKRRMVGNVSTIASMLAKQLGSSRVASAILPNEDHASTFPTVLPAFFRFCSTMMG